jgi:hypothetical protein
MLPALLRFEWRYHTRRVSFVVTALGLAAVSAGLVGTGYGPAGVKVNSPYVVAQSLGVLSLLSVFVLTVFCAPAALRDAEHGMTGIVYATPVGKPRYLLGRLGGALLAGGAVLGLAALILLLAPLLLAVEPERLGTVQPLAYAWALLVLVLPNLLLVSTLLFGVAMLSRSTLATYVGAVAIYALYLVCALLTDSPLMAGTAPPTPEALARAALLDPFGLSAFFEQTRYWTPAERDGRLVAFSGHLLLNRLGVLGLSAAVLALVYARFSFDLAPRRPGRAAAPVAETVPTVVYQPVVPGRRSAAALGRELRWALGRELGHVLRGWPFLTLLTLWVFVVGMECAAQTGGGEYGSHQLPTTGLMLDALHLPLLLLGTITVVYYAAEVAWRERSLGVAPLLDATPAPSAVFYLAKAAALSTLPLLLALVGMLVGALVQLANGYARLEPGLYLSELWLAGLPLVLFAVGALALQVLSPNRWVGMMAGLALGFVAYRGPVLGLEHPMWHFGTGPAAPHSDMDGFGPVLPSFAAFMLYWTVVAAALAGLSAGLWPRGPEVRLGRRLRELPAQWGRAGRTWALGLAALLLLVGGGLYWQTSRRQPWESRAAHEAWKAGYEQHYRYLAGRPQPSVVAVRLNVDLYPARRRARLQGSYVLENRSTQPIDTVSVSLPRGLGGGESRLTLPGARLLRYDARYELWLFGLRRPLAPGQRAALRFRVAVDRGGIRAGGWAYDVTANGTFLTSYDALPMLGYRAGYELTDPATRRQHRLTAPPSGPPPAGTPGPDWLTLDATVSTSLDQTVLAPGQLVRTWTRGPRRYFRYRQARPVTPNFAFLSARYAVRCARQAGVIVEVWYHPAHAANAPRVLAAATRAVRELSARYGAYPQSVLRIAEVPAWSPFGAFAMPGLVLFTEDRGFTADARPGDVDLLTRRVAHEVAHQWWGHRLAPAPALGASTLVETLAKHSEQLVLAAVHGEAALPALLAYDEDRYLKGRAEAALAEPTMLTVDDEAYLYYGKGAVMMNALRAQLGPAAVDRALRRLLAAHGGPGRPVAAQDLQAALLAEAPTEAARAAVAEWFRQRVVRELRVDTAVVRSLQNGRFAVTVRFSAQKTATEGRRETTRPADGEVLDVVLLDGAPGAGQVVYAGQVPVRGGRAALQLLLPRRPAYAVVDPYIHCLDRDRSNNQRRFEAGP